MVRSPNGVPKSCWTLEYSGELEFSSPFMEQWTLDPQGVLMPEIREYTADEVYNDLLVQIRNIREPAFKNQFYMKIKIAGSNVP